MCLFILHGSISPKLSEVTEDAFGMMRSGTKMLSLCIPNQCLICCWSWTWEWEESVRVCVLQKQHQVVYSPEHEAVLLRSVRSDLQRIQYSQNNPVAVPSSALVLTPFWLEVSLLLKMTFSIRFKVVRLLLPTCLSCCTFKHPTPTIQNGGSSVLWFIFSSVRQQSDKRVFL